jgi:hypothetical protein
MIFLNSFDDAEDTFFYGKVVQHQFGRRRNFHKKLVAGLGNDSSVEAHRNSVKRLDKYWTDVAPGHGRLVAQVVQQIKSTAQTILSSGLIDDGHRGCQMVYFHTKTHNLGILSRALEWKELVYLCPFGTFVVVWYIIQRFGKL